ncbi:MAG: PKD domain-containing protein, partial [Planctomycetes bacterium]|nr:PKD domain-containing protein [Planctomycetota bacterium]
MKRLIVPAIIFVALHCLASLSFAQDTDSQIKYDTDPSFTGDGVYNLNGDNQTITHTANNQELVVYYIRIENDTSGVVPKFILSGTAGGAGWDIKYWYYDDPLGWVDKTTAIVEGNFQTDPVAFGSWAEVKIEVKPDGTVPGGDIKTILLDAYSFGPGTDGLHDVVKAVTICAMNYQSDGWIKRSYELDSAYVGNGIYNTNALSQTASQNVNSTITLTYHIKIENDGNTDPVLTVTGTGSGGGWTISYYDAVTPGMGADITDMLVLTGWSVALTKPSITPTNEVFFRADVTADLSVSAGASRDFYIVVASITDTAKVDTMCISSTCIKGATLTLDYGSKNPAVSNEFTNVAKLSMLQFTVSVPSANEDVNINSLILIASGTADDKNAISGVRLINDANKNGLYDAGETLLGGPAVFSADDATLNLPVSPSVILSVGSSQTWLIVYQLSGSGTNGKTMQVTLSNVIAAGRYSQSTITPGGLPLPSSTKTIDDFTVSTTTGIAPLEVSFGGLFGAGGSIMRYDWDFDYNGVSFRPDYSSAQSTNATYAYDIPGSYAAVLRITYYDGSTIDRIVYFDIQSAADAPVIYAIGTSVAPPIGSPPFAISFTANITATNGVKAYLWDFDGDGLIDYCSDTSAGANYTYRKAGTYGARLVLQDTAGHLTAAQQLVTVNPPASAYPTAQITAPLSPTTITVCDNIV